MNKIYELFSKKPYLAWYVSDTKKLSTDSLVEHVLNNGNWKDYLETEKILGVNKISIIFKRLKNKKRCNLRPRTINYFEKYYQKYA